MNASESKQPVSTGERAYGLLLRLYPRTFRNEYDRELRRLVRDRLRDDQPAGPGGVALFWTGMFADLARTAFQERWEQTVNVSTLARWGGPLAMLGGLLWAIAIAAVAVKPGDSSQWWNFEDASPVALVAALAITGALAALISRESLLSPGAATTATAFGGLSALLFLGGILTGAWYVTAGGVYALMVATLVAGVAMLSRRGAGEWIAWLLAIAALAMFPMNSENWQMWLGVPFGLAWMAAGYALWMRASDRIMPAT